MRRTDGYSVQRCVIILGLFIRKVEREDERRKEASKVSKEGRDKEERAMQ